MSKQIFIENKAAFDVEGKKLLDEFRGFLNIASLKDVRVINCYNFFDVTDEEFNSIKDELIFDESQNILYLNLDEIKGYDKAFRVSHKDGQYNQREDMVNDFLNFRFSEKGFVKTSKILLFNGINDDELAKIKKYYINFVDSKEMELSDFGFDRPEKYTGDIEFVEGFVEMNDEKLNELLEDFSMDLEDIKFVQEYFKKEGRNPSVCELKMLDTYWSDHCRHTTFLTEFTDIEVEDGLYKEIFEEVLADYKASRKYVHNEEKPICLMDLATINMKELKKNGILDNLEKSDEVNACSIEIKVDVDGKDEDYLLMFKNETHNHPTEIEPYGGAHTCIGGGIRDPLSARSYVFQAMRITGAKNPFVPFEETIDKKLPQRKLCQMAMQGYSDYGNQIGCTGGLVKEIYHDGFAAKRMELGALVSCVKKSDIIREKPEKGDVILLLGAKTGRDGLGAAIGSSKIQTVKSLEKAGAEVQKGNPYEERNIIRLFRNPDATKLIKKCNDFGAGGVSVAIGELADGLFIDLSKVKLKYEGLNDWEIALSESQERMAVVVSEANLDKFLEYVKEEVVDYSIIAKVTDDNKVTMVFNGQTSVDIKREFLDTNGVRKKTKATLTSPRNVDYLLKDTEISNVKEDIKSMLSDINYASQKNLISNFDNSIGRGTILSQLGGKNQLTPQEGMVARIPLLKGETKTCSIMTYGYDALLSEQNEFLGGYYAVISSLAKQVALGGDIDKVRLSFQEFYERLGNDSKKWGKPLKSLLGAFKVLKEFELATIGGKDSMSGTFGDINVPPSLFSFAVSYDKVDNIISKEFKKLGSKVIFVEAKRDDKGLLDLISTKELYKNIKKAVDNKLILSASSIEKGILYTVLEMAFGNDIAVNFEKETNLNTKYIGSFVLEVKEEDLSKLGFEFEVIGTTEKDFVIKGEKVEIAEIKEAYTSVFDSLYEKAVADEKIADISFASDKKTAKVKKAEPKVLIPIFRGTVGEYDLQQAFEKEGAKVSNFIFNFRTKEDFKNSLSKFADEIKNYDILALASGSPMGSEVEQKGMMYDVIFNSDIVKSAINEFVKDESKLVIGINEAFGGLVKSGLIEFGEIKKGTSIKILPNEREKFVSQIVDVKVVSNNSAFMNENSVGDIYQSPIATKNGRLYFDEATFEKLSKNGQITTVFANENVTNSKYGVESLTSPSGRIFGCIAGIDRIEKDLFINNDIQNLSKAIKSAVDFYK